jgi:hypothetical protein
MQLRLVQYVHRHGDRTPITTVSDPDFWASLLPSGEQHEVWPMLKDEGEPGADQHLFAGTGPFGQLTVRGFQQLDDEGFYCFLCCEGFRNRENNRASQNNSS